MAFPRRLQARVGIRAPGHDGCSRRRGLQLPAAAGPRDPLGLLNDVRDLMDQDVQPALAVTAPRGRHEHAVPRGRRRVAVQAQEGGGPRPGMKPDPAQVH